VEVALAFAIDAACHMDEDLSAFDWEDRGRWREQARMGVRVLSRQTKAVQIII
jgi:hypothetical protein